MITCPSCNEKTPDNGLFCDQCGTELKICPKCGNYGKVNRCGECGTILQTVAMLKKQNNQTSGTNPSGGTTSAGGATPAGNNAPTERTAPTGDNAPTGGNSAAGNSTSATPSGGSAPAAAPQKTIMEVKTPTHFSNRELNINLALFHGMIIGRNTEKHNTVFATNGTISRSHCTIQFINHQVTITDLGSTNGTFLNDAKLAPNVAQPIKCGDVVKIAFTKLDVL